MNRYNCPKCKSENTITCGSYSTCCDCKHKGNTKEFDRIRLKLPVELSDEQTTAICTNIYPFFNETTENFKQSKIGECKEWYRAIRKEFE